MVSRFTHLRSDTVPLGTYLPPWTVREPLERMELTEAAREHQQAAIDAWLSCHEPLPVLREGLVHHGFLPGDTGDDPRGPAPEGARA